MRRLSLDDVLQALPPLVLPLVESLVEAAAERDLAIHLVGGPVRDLLLERPIRDVDLMVSAPEPERADTRDCVVTMRRRFSGSPIAIGSATEGSHGF